MKRKFIAEYWKYIHEGNEEIRVEILDRPDYLTYAPKSLDSMRVFILEELACMEELALEDIEIEFREVSKVK